jgi:hypothetical protein
VASSAAAIAAVTAAAAAATFDKQVLVNLFKIDYSQLSI